MRKKLDSQHQSTTFLPKQHKGVAAQKRPSTFYFGCDYCLSTLVALRTYKIAKGAAGVQRPNDR